jgi:hypothetical protein
MKDRKLTNLEHRAPHFVGIVFGVYLLSCGIATIYFNYLSREQGFFHWLLFGEVAPTLKGLIWPYYAYVDWAGSANTQGRLNTNELDRFASIARGLSLAHPEVTQADLANARSILTDYTKRTGHQLTRATFQAQVRWSVLDIEWKAELTASMISSWDKQLPTKSDRLMELERILPQYGASEEVETGNLMIIATSQRQLSFTQGGISIPLLRDKLPEIEARYRIMLKSYNTIFEGISDLLR